MRRYYILLLVLVGLVWSASPVIAGGLAGSLRSDYYMYQDAGKNNKYIFTQAISGEMNPSFMSKGWKLVFSGEFRDSNSPAKGHEDGRITTLILSRKIIKDRIDFRLGRFMARAGGFSPINGVEIAFPTRPFRATLAFGSEYYPIYRTETSSLPERNRAAVLLEGVIPRGPTWKLDHVSRFKSGDVDDQVTTLRLRCRRLTKFGWDARVGYDSKESSVRDWMYGVIYKPKKDLQFGLRYSERRYRIYQDSFFAQYEAAPTKLAGLTARYRLTTGDLWLGLGVTRRFREAGDLDRIFASVSCDMGEIGIRLQTGDDMNQFGGWFNAGGRLIHRLNWNVAVNFDRWDSAWNTESTEEWANSLGLTYPVSSIADLECRVEQFQTGELKSDIRGLLTFKMRYGL